MKQTSVFNIDIPGMFRYGGNAFFLFQLVVITVYTNIHVLVGTLFPEKKLKYLGVFQNNVMKRLH